MAFLIFIKLTLAFDSTDRVALWQALDEKGVNTKLLHVVKLLHQDNTAVVRFASKGSPVVGYQITRLLASQNWERCPDSASWPTPRPDIRVSERVERENGLRARGAEREENADGGERIGDERTEDRKKKLEQRGNPGGKRPRSDREREETRRTWTPPRPRRDVA
ncbi:hypothetical protein NDU88_007715 [Pleurodeles waltl]|uniref:Uncharacterized protein n=1 Tax=Pleurodeles waltl TaxID=8319 RepID=A0AAV7QPL9_PLEWA|nr:hypothetical protein NDU88_007715 [Pleurodeles waltl]